MPPLLTCDSLSKAYRFPLFRGLSLNLSAGEKTGLIGPNGKGKSTLLRILSGLEQPDEGSTFLTRGTRRAYVPQEDLFDEELTVQKVLEKELEGSQKEDYEQSTQIDITLTRLGFSDWEQVVKTLSGGWKKRLSLARALVHRPEILLLDEPTNHLDIEGILWLEDFLKRATFAFLMVTHDRYILESTTNRIIELDPTYPEGYLSVSGNYSTFLARRAEFLENQARLEETLANKVRREIEWLRQGITARGTRANYRIKKASNLMGELEEVKQRNAPGQVEKVDFSSTQRKSKKLMEVKNLSMNRGGKKLFGNLDFILSAGSRLGLIGPNGSGKSTLVRLLLEELAPVSGEVRKLEGVQAASFDQHREKLDKTQELRWALSPEGDQVLYRGRAIHIKSWARRFHFEEQQLGILVGDLSGGEQSRILLSRMMVQPVDILLLDEPTNDLDIPTLEVLEESLSDFPGALVLITHDRYLLDRLCTEILALDGRGNHKILASYSQWETWQEGERARESQKKEQKKITRPPSQKTPKGLNYKEKRELDSMEENILKAEEKLEKCKKILEDPKVMADYQKLQQACETMEKAQAEVDQLYGRWEELEEKRGQ